MNQLNLKLFGALRKYGVDAKLELSVPSVCTIGDLQHHLAEHLTKTHSDFVGPELLDECAFANEDRILLRDEMVPLNGFVAVLPPVCGG